MDNHWQPIYSVERGGVPELTIAGAVCVVEGRDSGLEPARTLITLGDTDMKLWTRSLLKPWQLLSHLPELQAAYPQLRPDHLAVMMASHNAEQMHLDLLQEIMQIGGAREEWLACPASYPQHAATRNRLKADGLPQRKIYHNCSGKHFGYLLTIKSAGGNVADYVSFAGEHFAPLKEMLASLVHRGSSELPATTDGCQMPNYAVSIHDMASLYQGLANWSGSDSSYARSNDRFALYPQVRSLMTTYPQLIGGSDRLDTKIMSGLLDLKGDPVVIAKEGADGLLAIGVGPCAQYQHGLGVLIKVSTGSDAKQMELIARELFAQLQLCQHGPENPPQPKGTRSDHLRIKFHFAIDPSRRQATDACAHVAATPLCNAPV